MSELISINDLRVNYKSRKGIIGAVTINALDGISLSIDKGENLAVVGESGSGKTTLGKATVGLIKPASGEVIFDRHDISKMDVNQIKDLRKRTQVIFQDPYSSLDTFMNVGQILEEPLLIHGVRNSTVRNQMIAEALETVRLSPVEDILPKYPHMLSGGLRQRVGIARALIMKPDFILADEPVSMIDASSRAEILYLMRTLQKTYGITILYITHDIATARHFSDRIAVIYGGHLVEIGPSDKVVGEPMHPYTSALIESIPQPNSGNRLKHRAVIDGEPPSPVNPPHGCRFHPRCPRFMANKCELHSPILRDVNNGHKVSCYLWEN